GMNPEGMAAWFHQGDGLKLWEEAYGSYNLVARVGPGVGPQMGGWVREKITTIVDFKTLRVRTSTMGRTAVARTGATTGVTADADIYEALERGVIDVAEWVGPYDDMALNLHNTARYY